MSIVYCPKCTVPVNVYRGTDTCFVLLSFGIFQFMVQDAPFKARINGMPCVVVMRRGNMLASFEMQDSSLGIPYSDIRCVQYLKGHVLLNAEKDGRLVAYVISSPMARKIHNILLESMKSWCGNMPES